MTAEHVQVAIVGAGPVGVVAATLLAQRGIDSVILEHHLTPYPLPRAVHLDDEVHCILRELGLDRQFAAISRPMPGMRLVDARHHTLADFPRHAVIGPLGCPQASMFDQPDLEQMLLDNLANHRRVTLRRGCTVTSIAHDTDAVQVGYIKGGSERNLTADAVLGCDGANSLVRDTIGAQMRDLKFCERWLVVDLRTPTPLDVWGGVHQICDPSRPATFMHVTGTRYRWEFQLADGEDVDNLTTRAGLARLLTPWFGPSLPDDVEVVRQTTYVFKARVAQRWRHGRVFLLGDAAHLTPPFIGQGLGAGLRDAHNLAWKLAGVLHGELTEDVLDTYETERLPHAVRTVRAAVAVGWALTGGQDRAALLRKSALALLCRIPGITHAVLDTASPPLGRSALITGRRQQRSIGRVYRGVLHTGAGPYGFTVVTGDPPTAADAQRLRDADVAHTIEPGRHDAVLVRPDGAVAANASGPSAVATLLDLVASVSSTPRTPMEVTSS